ncbi:MAG TPA: hypothetical protein VN045_03260 [Microbacteriaceae bacterium]|nr:hypothetical protein [Microbacteriaceae bacterium]
MRNRRRIAIIAGIVIVAFIVFTVGTTVVLNLAPKPPAALTQVTYKQTKAVLGWDDSTHTTTDPARLSAMHDVLVKDGWKPGDKRAGRNGCAGGTATQLGLTFAGGTQSQLTVYECGRDADALTKDITDLVTSWRS